MLKEVGDGSGLVGSNTSGAGGDDGAAEPVRVQPHRGSQRVSKQQHKEEQVEQRKRREKEDEEQEEQEEEKWRERLAEEEEDDDDDVAEEGHRFPGKLVPPQPVGRVRIAGRCLFCVPSLDRHRWRTTTTASARHLRRRNSAAAWAAPSTPENHHPQGLMDEGHEEP